MGELKPWKQRKHDRIQVEYAASFSGPWFGEAVILDLSMGGCRARRVFAVKKDDCLGVLIDVPRYEHPLYIVRAVVRWVDRQECGMEFIQIEPGDQRRLRELIRATKTASPRRTENDDSPIV